MRTAGAETRIDETKRDTFLNIRLTADELNQLKEIAVKMGMGPSTYARQLIKAQLSKQPKTSNRPDAEAPDLGDAINNLGQNYGRAGQGGICLFDVSSARVNPDILQSLLYTLDKVGTCCILNPGDMGYAEAEQLIKGSLEIR